MMNRNSNIELLRIVVMFYVLILHVNLKGIWGNIEVDFPILNVFSIFIEAFAVIAVNCFVLISGYFGIKFNLKTFFRLISQCIFYNVIIYVTISLLNNNFDLISLLRESVIFSHWWFVKSYILLIIFSPILNEAILKLDKKTLSIVLILLLVLRPNNINFFLLYLIGGFIHRFFALNNMKSFRIYFIVFYITISTILGVILLVCKFIGGIQYGPYIIGYNSLFIIFSSISFFFIFLLLKVENSLINSIATSSFAVYLIHEHHLVSPYFSKAIECFILLSDRDEIILSICLLVFIVLIFSFSVLIDKIRIFLFRCLYLIVPTSLFNSKINRNTLGV